MGRLRMTAGFFVTLLIALLLSFVCQPNLAGQKPQEQEPSNDLAGPELVARATDRIERDLSRIRVYRNDQVVRLEPFHELVPATPVARGEQLRGLVGKSVTIIRSLKEEGEWEIYTGVGGVGGGVFVLAGNIFRVRQVILSGLKNPIEIRVNGQTHRLKPGQALIVLG